VIQGIKKGSKIKVIEIALNQIHCVDLFLMILLQLERDQTDLYERDIASVHFPKQETKMMTVQSV
jgi:hypothetical protein